MATMSFEHRWYLSQQVICFGQLLGMCDNLSFPLGERPISLKDCIVSPPPFRPSGLQRVQVRSIRSRQRGAPLPFQVTQTVQGSFCLVNHILPRRAHENKGILEKLEKEKSLLKRELRDRVGILLNVKETMIIRSNNKKMINKDYEKFKNKKWQLIGIGATSIPPP